MIPTWAEQCEKNDDEIVTNAKIQQMMQEEIDELRKELLYFSVILATRDNEIRNLKKILTEIIAISDRKHDAWDRAKVLLKKAREK